MVIYHSLNYSTQRELAFRYLAFLPPSFILITGYLLSYVYLPKCGSSNWQLHARLMSRGLRLLGLFTVLNVLVQLFIPRGLHGVTPGLRTFWQHWSDTYVSGDGSLAVFDVLLPIAYLLLVAPLLLGLERHNIVAFSVITVATLGSLTLLDREGEGWRNVQLLSAGLAGMLIGRIAPIRFEDLFRFRWLAVLAYAVCFAVGFLWGQTYLLQLLSAIAALAVIYAWTNRKQLEESFSAKRLEVLGRYSLVSYIAQLGILHVLTHLMGHPQPGSFAFLGLFVGTLVLTAGIGESLDWIRYRSATVGEIYKAVFA